MVPGLQQSAQEFYASIEACLSPHGLQDLSADREYQQIRQSSHVFHVCAAPYGNGLFVSSWLGQIESGFFAWLASLPLGRIFQRFVKPLTYYKVDTASMFQSIAHGAVLAALDGVTPGQRTAGAYRSGAEARHARFFRSNECVARLQHGMPSELSKPEWKGHHVSGTSRRSGSDRPPVSRRIPCSISVTR